MKTSHKLMYRFIVKFEDELIWFFDKVGQFLTWLLKVCLRVPYIKRRVNAEMNRLNKDL